VEGAATYNGSTVVVVVDVVEVVVVVVVVVGEWPRWSVTVTTAGTRESPTPVRRNRGRSLVKGPPRRRILTLGPRTEIVST